MTSALLDGARGRRGVTASLQASRLAEGLYARQAFRDLGRILEHGRSRPLEADGR